MSLNEWEQTNRQVRLRLDLGSDAVIPLTFRAIERLGEPFSLVLQVVSKGAEIDFLPHLGKAVGLDVCNDDGETLRVFHGLLAEADHLEAADDGDRYALTVRPWLWFLSRSRGYVIYQEKTALEIIEAVFTAAGFNDYDASKISSKPPVRPYCVKFRESDYDFVMRLMEEEGLYFYFDHQHGRHVLTLCDGPGAHKPLPGGALPYIAIGKSDRMVGKPHVYLLREQVSSSVQKVVLRDFDFTQPATLLAATSIEGGKHDHDTSESYDYPGGFTDAARGEALAQTRLEAAQAERRRFHGESQAPQFACGALVTVAEHPNARFNRQVLVVELDYEVMTETLLSSRRERLREDRAVTARFRAIPATTPWRSPLRHPRPVARGPETAIVTGPAGEEIYVDAYGRVKVHFHWDREQPKDETCSCWVRVSHGWAGGGFGMVNLPRVGQEVIVDFLDGDPDRPLITGRVYNAATTTPYTLPDNKTQAGWRSKSIGSSGFNEIRYEDKADAEQIYVHAQKDMDTEVLNNRTATITKDETKTVKEGDETHTVSQGKRTTTVQMTDALTVVQGDHTTQVDLGDMATTLGMGNKSVLLSTGNLSVATEIGAMAFTATESISITSELSITLTVGENSITLSQSGIAISGVMVSADAETSMSISGLTTEVSGETSLSLSGAMVEVSGEATTTIEAALVMIN